MPPRQKRYKPEPWLEVLKRFLRHGFEAAFPVAIDKNDKLHSLFHEGFPMSWVGRGDNYEEIVASLASDVE